MFTWRNIKLTVVITANFVLALFLIVFRSEFIVMTGSTVDPISAFIGKMALLLTWLFALYLVGLAVALVIKVSKAGKVSG